MSKSLCTFNHLLAEELQGTAALCLQIKDAAGLARERRWHRCCVGACSRGTPGEGAISQQCFDGIITRRG